jgi:Ca2+-transporting ATPase
MAGRYAPLNINGSTSDSTSPRRNGLYSNVTSAGQPSNEEIRSSAWLQDMKSPDTKAGNISYAYAGSAPAHSSSGFPTIMSPSHPQPSTPAHQEQQFAFSTTLRRATIDEYSNTSSYPPASQLESPNDNPSAVATHQSLQQVLDTYSLPATHLNHGLSNAAVPQFRAMAGGANEFSVKAPDSPYQKFLEQFKEPLILLLLGSAVVSGLMGEWDDAISIAVAVVIVITVGFIQERRSEKSLEALNKLVPHYCHLIRENQSSTILANDLVPGDVVTFSTGDRIPADVRVFEAVSLEVDESTLTGEIKPRRKTADITPRPSSDTETNGSAAVASINERENITFMGTLVRRGYGKGIVVGTGSQTEFGKIFGMVDEVQEKRTPLQLSMDDLAKNLSMISFGIIGIICFMGILQHKGWLEMFTIGVSLAVAAIPEGLPIVVTVTLALGVLRMSKRKAIVKRLPSVETLGCVSVVCSDKTGTLTCNEMTVVRCFTVDDGIIDLTVSIPHTQSPALSKVLLIGNICNKSYRDDRGGNVGQPTDVAMVNVLRLFGLEDRRPYFKSTHEVPFDSEKKYMSVVGGMSTGGRPGEESTYMKGALEVILGFCSHYSSADGRKMPLDEGSRGRISAAATELSNVGLRVLATATGAANGADTRKLVFCGLQAMQDPPRPGVKESIASLHRGGVQVVMITGDAEDTAVAIAKQLGILYRPASHLNVMTGKQLNTLTQRQLQDKIDTVCVFARTNPRHKMRIVEAFQTNGQVVAMTGDGVNDAPALKMADIGISMGKGGTDVAKEAADVILVDDNFATILPAVEEGKGIFYNIQNFLCFQLSTAVSALTLITISTALGLKNPLNAMQILFINILMDGPPSQSLGVDPVDPSIMKRPPRKRTDPIITQRLIARIAFSATTIVLGTIYIYWTELNDGFADVRDQTMTFTCFVFLDLTSAIQSRGLSVSLLPSPNGNRMLLTTVGMSLFTQLTLIYFPPLQGIFQTTALGFNDLVLLIFIAGISFSAHEARRRWERNQGRQEKLNWEDSIV